MNTPCIESLLLVYVRKFIHRRKKVISYKCSTFQSVTYNYTKNYIPHLYDQLAYNHVRRIIRGHVSMATICHFLCDIYIEESVVCDSSTINFGLFSGWFSNSCRLSLSFYLSNILHSFSCRL